MEDTIRSVRVFAGLVDSSRPQLRGFRAPAVLTLIERETEFECRFVFFVGTVLPLTVHAAKSGRMMLSGVASDPRGWDVSFSAELDGDQVRGSYEQPHDQGTFNLREV